MTKLYLIRHGLTEWNVQNRMQGMKDIPLCEEGVRQALDLSDRFKETKIGAIYSSDLTRAYNTALLIAKHHSIAVNKDKLLRELHFEEWEGKTLNELKNLKEFNHWKKYPHTFTFPDGKCLKDIQDKIINFVERIIKKHIDENIFIISHGGSLKLIILGLMGFDISFYNKFTLYNASVSIIDIKEDKNVLLLLNG